MNDNFMKYADLTSIFYSIVDLLQLVLIKYSIFAFQGMAGLAVTYGLNLNARQSRWVLSLCKLENRIISVERIQQYTRLPKEAPAVIKGARPPRDWPTSGTIEIVNLQVYHSFTIYCSFSNIVINPFFTLFCLIPVVTFVIIIRIHLCNLTCIGFCLLTVSRCNMLHICR